MTASGRIWAFGVWLAAGAWSLGCSTAGESLGPDGGPLGDSGGSLEPILDGGGAVPMPPNGASECPSGGTCSYETQDPCPASQTCEPNGTDGTATCLPAGTKQSGEMCVMATECARGMICAEGTCHRICCGVAGNLKDWTVCPANEHCLRELTVQLVSMSTVDTHAFLCYPVNTCDALVPSSCPATPPGKTCQIADGTGVTACLSEGTGVAGDTCPCKGGYTCVSNGCRRLCKAVAGGGDPACPPSEGRCVHFNRDPNGVGECTPI